MTEAATKLLDALPEPLRRQVTFQLEDPERLNWHFIPRERKGVPIKALSPEQQRLVKALISAGTSERGYQTALEVMALEAILRQMEDTGGARRFPRDPELYYVSIFGTPSASGKWGWRIEGHHLCLNYLIDAGRVAAATPIFFGANPAQVPKGFPKEGTRTLPRIEELARQLYQSLAGEVKTKATIGAKAPADILSGAQNTAPPAVPDAGAAASELNPTQRDVLANLYREYVGRYPAETAEALMAEFQAAPPNQVRFAWAGPATPGQGHYYRIIGPTFLIEYCNTQNGANHIHSVFRKRQGDFGLTAGGS
jgi:hypothetical protein